MSRLVFIAGVHRSGSSLLHDLVGAYPEVSRFRDTGVPQDEGQHLQSVIPPAAAYGGPGRFGPRAALDEAHARPELADALLEAWRPRWDPAAPLHLEKSPPNVVRTRFLQALFPDASFLLLLRNPVVVALSTQRWTRQPFGEALAHTLFCQERLVADSAALRAAHSIRYESLVADPDGTMRGVERFLGLGEHPVAVPIDAGRNRSDVEAFLGRAGRADLEAIADFGHRIEALGYRVPQRASL